MLSLNKRFERGKRSANYEKQLWFKYLRRS